MYMDESNESFIYIYIYMNHIFKGTDGNPLVVPAVSDTVSDVTVAKQQDENSVC